MSDFFTNLANVVTSAIGGGAPSASAAQWKLLDIPVESRPILDLKGQPLLNGSNPPGQVGVPPAPTPGQPPPPTSFPQWMDPDLYVAWVAYARQRFNAAVRSKDVGALKDACVAITQAYNALNIPWVIDPPARFLHQRYIAGAPGTLVAPNPLQSEFGPRTPYNDTVWLAPKGGDRCVIEPGFGPTAANKSYGGCNSDSGSGNTWGMPAVGTYTGLIPRLARAAFDRDTTDRAHAASHPTQFVPRLQFILRAPALYSKLGPGAPYNAVPPERTIPNPWPFDLGILSADVVTNDVVWNGETLQIHEGADPEGWDSYALDSNWSAGFEGVAQQVRPSYGAYVPYLEEWIRALESRSAANVVQDARAYAVYRNVRAQQAAGGTFQSIAGNVIANANVLSTPNGTVGNELRIAGAAAAATGAALSTVTFGISALVGGAVAAITTVSADFVAPDLHTTYIDDLERPKPWIERSWLAGSPADASPDGMPALVVPGPPGWTRPHAPIGNFASLHIDPRLQIAFDQQNGLTYPPLRGNFFAMLASVPWWVWAGSALVVGGGVVYAGSAMTQGSRRTSSRGRRASSRRRSR
jgi:hypothetical protein